MKYILVTGGVLSGIGKGIIASSTGMCLKAMGFRVTSIKIDPYLNLDAGTMSPFEHGEVFVCDDGAESDLDIGNYERFLDVTLTRDNNITTGKVYNRVIEKERRGEFLGRTVQVVPHVSDEIQAWVERVSRISVDGHEGPADICVMELGGTIGDIESMPFIEAMRQFQFRVGPHNFCQLHVSLVPVIGVVGEQKTKPTQQSIRELRALGLSPDVILCRSAQPLTDETKKKLGLFCHVTPENVVGVHDVSNIYRVPLLLQEQGLPTMVLKKLQLDMPVATPTNRIGEVPAWLLSWSELANRMDILQKDVLSPIHIAMVGKYTGLSDAYLSVVKSLEHASLEINRRVLIDWIEATSLEPPIESQANDADGEHATRKHEEAWALLKGAHGILVPGGFGDRGVEGMIVAANYARTSGKPYLGICLGMQVAVIEVARNVLGYKNANSEEIIKNKELCDPAVVIYMPEISKTHMGGTMRLGSRKTVFNTLNCITAQLYGVDKANPSIEERHRHRYEINPELIEQLQDKGGLKFVGHDSDRVRMEVVELPAHEFFVGVQFHPEFKSRPCSPSPPFVGLLLACWRHETRKKMRENQLLSVLNKWNMSTSS